MTPDTSTAHTGTPAASAVPAAAPAPDAHQPSDYPWHHAVSTRWGDNDIYGHVNNAVYYQYFDSAINALLIAQAGLDIHAGAVVGFIVRSECDYLKPVAYPQPLDVGVRIERLGRSSVSYGLALFDAAGALCARGRMVHVFVDKASSRPVALPERLREGLRPYAAAASPPAT